MEDRDVVVDDYLNEHYPITVIEGCSFTPAQIVRALDAPLYRQLSGEFSDDD